MTYKTGKDSSFARLMRSLGKPDITKGKVLHRDSKFEIVEVEKPTKDQLINDSRNEIQSIKFARDPNTCDLELKVGNKSSNLHKIILSKWSNKYLDWFDDNKEASNEIIMEGEVNPETLDEVVDYLYTGQMRLTKANIFDVVNICIQLGLTELLQHCVTFMRNDDDQPLVYLPLSKQHHLLELQHHLINSAIKHFPNVATTPEFLNMDADHLIEIIGSSRLRSGNQNSVFKAVLRWVSHQPDRWEIASQLVSLVNLHKVEPNLLCLMEDNDKLIALIEIKKMLCDAYKYHSMVNKSSCAKRSDVSVPTKPILTEPSLIVCGYPFNDSTDVTKLQSVYMYDIYKSLRWEFVTEFPEQLSSVSVVYLNRKLYVLGGLNRDRKQISYVVDSVFSYDFDECKWKTQAPMLNKRVSFGVIHFTGNIFVIGGLGENNRALCHVECYEPDVNKWSQMPSLPVDCVSPAVCVHDNSIYVIGGYLPTKTQLLTMATVLVFHKKSFRWEARAPLPSKLFAASATVVDDNLFVIGGADMSVDRLAPYAKGSIYKYDIVQDYWTHVDTLVIPRWSAGVFALEEDIYVVGGLNHNHQTPLASMECFNVKTLKGRFEPIMNVPNCKNEFAFAFAS